MFNTYYTNSRRRVLKAYGKVDPEMERRRQRTERERGPLRPPHEVFNQMNERKVKK